MPESTPVAVLIDCDNISAQWADAIVAETAGHGTLIVKRGYGDWTNQHLTGWRQALARLAVQPVQQFAYVAGKNATDSALIIDAMDLLYAGHVETFCLVSNDSDFTPLAMRLRESGKRVIGIGARNASQAFQNACDRFTFLEVLTTEEREPSSSPEQEPPDREVLSLDQAAAVILPAISAAAKDDGWAALSTLGSVAVNRDPTFDSRNYGYAKLGLLVRALRGVEIKEVPDGNDFRQIWVRVRTRSRATPNEDSRASKGGKDSKPGNVGKAGKVGTAQPKRAAKATSERAPSGR